MSRCCDQSTTTALGAGDDGSGNDSIIVTGTGKASDPFVVSFRGLTVDNTATIDLELDYTGGSLGLGYALSATFAATSKLDDLGDVDASAPANGEVPMWNSSTSKWEAAAPTTATAGSVNTDTSLDGDGSVGTPLAVAHDPDRSTETTPSGIGLTEDGVNSLVRRFTDDTSRSATPIAPALNTLSALDDTPGVFQWWDGADWQPAQQVTDVDFDAAFLELSGPYDGRAVQIMTRVLSTTSDSAGAVTLLDTTDLSGYGGVLSVMVTPVGTTVYHVQLDDAPTTEITGMLYDAAGAALPDWSPVSLLVHAVLY